MGAQLSRQLVCAAVVFGALHESAAFTSVSGATRALRPRRLAAARRATPSMATEAAPAPAFRDLTDRLPDCPETKWNAEDIDLTTARAGDDLPETILEWEASAADNAAGAAYFAENSDDIKAKMQKHGCVWFRGFDLMKDSAGFRGFYEALGDWAEPCLDPIHTSGLRSFADQQNAVYEEVNKKSLSRHYIGLHNEVRERAAIFDSRL